MRTHHCCLLAMLALSLAGPSVSAKQPAGPPQMSPGRPAGPPQVSPGRPVAPPQAPTEEYFEPGQELGSAMDGEGCCLDGCQGCAQQDCCAQDCCGAHPFCIAAGYSFVFLQPHFENDIAFVSTIDDGEFARVSDTSFNYDLEVTPRVWIEICKPNQLGFRVTWWQFDHASPTRVGVVNDSGFETISAPIQFRDIVIAATTPDDIFGAQADLKIDVLDFEGTKWTDFCTWQFGTTAGLRYASLRHSYQAASFNDAGVPQDIFDSSHRFDGMGPTFSVEARRPMGCLTWFSMARGSLLYGNGKHSFTALEDITPAGPGLTTVARFNRNDVLTAAEVQVGLEWCKQCCSGKRLFCRAALEGQVWQGFGSATQEDGDLGLFGFQVALGTTL